TTGAIDSSPSGMTIGSADGATNTSTGGSAGGATNTSTGGSAGGVKNNSTGGAAGGAGWASWSLVNTGCADCLLAVLASCSFAVSFAVWRMRSSMRPALMAAM